MTEKKSDAQTGASLQPTTDHWPGPAGMIPVTSGRADDANVHNRNFLDHLLVEMRLIDAVKPDLTTMIFGKKYASPLTLAAVSHLNQVLADDHRQPMQEKARAAKQLGVLNWVGMEDDPTFTNIAQQGAATVRIIKPFADHQRILREIQVAADQGAVAVGIDIDHVPGADGGYDVVDGLPMGPLTASDLQSYVHSTKLPFIAKGVLSVQDAVKAQNDGCRGIVVSHHHGRVPFGMPPLKILPDILRTVNRHQMTVFVDGSLMSGYDAYKALALGADAVLIGRGILKELLDGGQEAVVEKVQGMDQELSRLMLYTGVKDTKSFDPTVIHYQ